MPEHRENKTSQKAEEIENQSLQETISRLDVDPEKGLSGKEVNERRKKYGKNTIEEEKENPLLKLLKNFWGPIPWMLEIAIILSAIAQRWEDFTIIFVMLLINGGVSYWHENKAESAIEALKEKLAPKATVLRNGKKKTIDSDKLVPGDIVFLKMGNIVPADVKMLEDQHISVDESALTGESLPVDKDENDTCFSGTTVKRGEAKAIIIATGQQTKFARTVELVESAEEKSHFQKAVLRIGYFLILATLFLVVVIIITGIVRNESIMDVLMFSLVLTIAGIPQALPAVLSVTMTIGARRLASQKAIVTKLSAMEEMAGLEVLCVDKTGTLTKNELELQDPVAYDAADANDLIVKACLTIKPDEEEDPIDLAISKGLEDKKKLNDYEVKEIRPFDPTKKRSEADVEYEGKSFMVTKGAPQVILDLAGDDINNEGEIKDKVEELARKGFRSLGVAIQQDERWSIMGILPLLDPPREDSKDVIDKAKSLGMDVRMVTGDHAAIGKQVAGQIGMGQKIAEVENIFSEEPGEEKEAPTMTDECAEANGFAQVTPEDKFNIIKAFQVRDVITGMTGDGVNDAPALKQADVGIAVSGSTDAARSASDLVLTVPGLGVIIQAIQEARRIFNRMISYSTFRITETMRVLLFMTISIIAFKFYPVTPIMIVLLAILNDIPVMTIAYDKVPTPRKPVRWRMKHVLTTATLLGIGGVISSFLLFWYLRTQAGLNTNVIQTMIFLKLLVAGHMTIFLTRNNGWLWQKPLPDLRMFLALEGTQIIGTLFAVYGWLIHPIGWEKALIVWGYAIVWLLILNMLKIVFIKIFNAEIK